VDHGIERVRIEAALLLLILVQGTLVQLLGPDGQVAAAGQRDGAAVGPAFQPKLIEVNIARRVCGPRRPMCRRKTTPGRRIVDDQTLMSPVRSSGEVRTRVGVQPGSQANSIAPKSATNPTAIILRAIGLLPR